MSASYVHVFVPPSGAAFVSMSPAALYVIVVVFPFASVDGGAVEVGVVGVVGCAAGRVDFFNQHVAFVDVLPVVAVRVGVSRFVARRT